jgi:catechol 2,3-dioxygenase-like lactoylglutathione lyase family enzyme
MISRLSHATIYVLNQDDAKAFYTEKLGFEVRTDLTMDGFRWLEVGPAGQPDLALVLIEPQPPMFDPETAAQLKAIIAKGGLGTGVFATADCRQTYAELHARGVEFLQEPTERPYGVEATFRDNSGNWFSLNQQPAQRA